MLTNIKKASKISQKTIVELKTYLKPSVTEKSLAHTAKKLLKKNGAQGLAFPTIVAFGTSSTNPHHEPTNKKLKSNHSVLIDLGAKVNGYCSDISRTFLPKNPTKLQHKVEETIKKSYRTALNHLSTPPPIKASKVDQSARSVIKKAGFGKYFIHGTGHGVGKKVHQPPRLDPKSKQIIKPGMVITIEPGIYIPGKFGYRHEDTILITKKGYQILT